MAKKKAPRYGDIVLVKWLDSCAPSRIWQLVDDALSYRVVECVSTGFWIKHDEKGLVLAQSVTEEEVGHITAIPPACIQSIEVLRRADE